MKSAIWWYAGYHHGSQSRRTRSAALLLHAIACPTVDLLTKVDFTCTLEGAVGSATPSASFSLVRLYSVAQLIPSLIVPPYYYFAKDFFSVCPGVLCRENHDVSHSTVSSMRFRASTLSNTYANRRSWLEQSFAAQILTCLLPSDTFPVVVVVNRSHAEPHTLNLPATDCAHSRPSCICNRHRNNILF